LGDPPAPPGDPAAKRVLGGQPVIGLLLMLSVGATALPDRMLTML
jgi:hypothetical protein